MYRDDGLSRRMGGVWYIIERMGEWNAPTVEDVQLINDLKVCGWMEHFGERACGIQSERLNADE